MSHLFCFGLGYSARFVANELSVRGWCVTGTSTSERGCEAIAVAGFRALAFDGRVASAAVAAALNDATHVLLSVPPEAGSDPAYLHHGANIAASPSIRWIGYFSTVGVYGDAAGGLVDEDTEPRPLSERGGRRLVAEGQWRALGKKTGQCVMVFRLPGIYGPGRSAIDDLQSGAARRIVKPGQIFNRIHVDDIAGAVVAGIERPHADGVYNVTDDEPGPPQDVVSYAARLLGIKPPPEIDFAAAELSAMARSFYSESKRVSNARMKSELGLRLRYPTYREGLAAILQHKVEK